MSSPEFSIIIPAYNEAERLEATLRRVVQYFEERGTSYEVLVVDDGSKDGTVELAETLAAEMPSIRVLAQGVNRGKGAAVRAGMLAADGRYLLFSDADLATPIEEIEKLEAALARGNEIAIASRALADSDIQVRQNPMREMMGRGFNLIVRAVMLGGIKDTQCGFKLFEREAARQLFGEATIEGFAFDVEILWLAQGRFEVAEVPVVWRHVDESKVSPGTDAARMFADILKLRWRHRRRR